MVNLKDVWWKPDIKCDGETAKKADNTELDMDNVGGVFVVLGGGCFVALIVAICEFLLNLQTVAIEEKVMKYYMEI